MGAKKVRDLEKKTDGDLRWPTYELTYEDVVDILKIIDRTTLPRSADRVSRLQTDRQEEMKYAAAANA